MEDTARAKVLLLDTSEENISSLSKILRSKNYDIRSSSTREEAIDFIQKWKPDLVILNIFVKSLDPLSFISELRENPFTANQKIIILSQSRKIENITGPAPKVRGYLTKPLDFEKLKNIISEITEDARGRKIRVMVADDDEEFCELVRMFLVSNLYEPIIVTNPLKIIHEVKVSKPDVLLLDITMPKKDGFEILDELQDEMETARVPIVILSALSLEKYQERGILTGLPEMIFKEYPGKLILEIVEKQISGSLQESGGKRKQEIKPCVLLADDQTELLILMKERLEEEGFNVVAAADGEEALQMVFQHHPDIAVLDYNMPFKDGLKIAQELKDNPLFAHIPIIIVTGEGKRDVKIKGLSMGIDDYLVKPVDTDELVARIRMILKRNKQVLDTNPLSKLPGNPSIQARIEREIARKSTFAVLYLDLNNFKAYNDAYGFEAGDYVIKTTANLLVKLTIQNENTEDFIGHIGGDDFIIITSFERAEFLCKRITGAFDEISPSFYNERDRKSGYIISTDRQGNVKKFPFLSISIGVVHNSLKPLTSFAQISNIGAELKKVAKREEKSAYFFDRRKD